MTICEFFHSESRVAVRGHFRKNEYACVPAQAVSGKGGREMENAGKGEGGLSSKSESNPTEKGSLRDIRTPHHRTRYYSRFLIISLGIAYSYLCFGFDLIVVMKQVSRPYWVRETTAI